MKKRELWFLFKLAVGSPFKLTSLICLWISEVCNRIWGAVMYGHIR